MRFHVEPAETPSHARTGLVWEVSPANICPTSDVPVRCLTSPGETEHVRGVKVSAVGGGSGAPGDAAEGGAPPPHPRPQQKRPEKRRELGWGGELSADQLGWGGEFCRMR